MISQDETDLMSWSSPSNNGTTKTTGNLAKPLIPTVNIQSPSIVNNPFDAICDKINSEIQNPFDDICCLVEMQSAKQCGKEDSVVNLLNMTIIANSREDLRSTSNPVSSPQKECVSNTDNPEVNTSIRSGDVSDILNVSSLDDNLLSIDSPDGKVSREMQRMTLVDQVKDEQKMRENNNFLSQSECDYSQTNTSMNDSFYEHGQRYHELCSRLDSSFNKSKTLYDEIVRHDQKALAAFKRRSAEFSRVHDREEEQSVIEKEALSTSQTICSKSALKPLESPDLKLRSCSSLKSLPSAARMTRDTGRRPSRQGPMKAMAPLKSMIKSSHVLPDKLDLNDTEKSQATQLFKSSYHKSPVKLLNLRSKSAGAAPRLTSSTPEKSANIPHASAFSSPSPLKSIPANPGYVTSPLKSIRSTSPFNPSSIPTSPLRTNGSQNSTRATSALKSIRSAKSVKAETSNQSIPTSLLTNQSIPTSLLTIGSQNSIRATSPLRSVEFDSQNLTRANSLRSPLISLLGSTSQKSIRSLRSPSPMKSVATIKSRAPSPLKSVATSPIKSLGRSPLKSVATSPMKSTLKPLKSVSSSQLKFPRASPLKSTSANVGGGSAHQGGGFALSGAAGMKPRSNSMSRLKPPKSFASKATRFNSSHDEKENFAVHYVL